MEARGASVDFEMSQPHSHLWSSELYADESRRADTVRRLHPQNGYTIVLSSSVSPREFEEELSQRGAQSAMNNMSLVHLDPLDSTISSTAVDKVSRVSPADITGVMIEVSKSLDIDVHETTHIHLFDAGIIGLYHNKKRFKKFLQHITRAARDANAQLSIHVRPEVVTEEQIHVLESITDTSSAI